MHGQNNFQIYLFSSVIFQFEKKKYIKWEKTSQYHSQHWYKNSLRRNGPRTMQMKIWKKKKNPGSQSRV